VDLGNETEFSAACRSCASLAETVRTALSPPFCDALARAL
jgi:hypothetical protein